ncbi:MAG: DUF402 domain-containing protein [Mycobacterium leprae]
MKRILIDMENRVERHLLSGNCYNIDRRLERKGGNIYLERTYHNHATIAAARSILLPESHLWVMFWEGHQGPHRLRSYTHVARVLDDGGPVITVEDLYLDVIVPRGGQWQLLDVDEFREAIHQGELTPEQIQAALQGLENACALVERSVGEVETYLQEVWLKER